MPLPPKEEKKEEAYIWMRGDGLDSPVTLEILDAKNNSPHGLEYLVSIKPFWVPRSKIKNLQLLKEPPPEVAKNQTTNDKKKL